MAISMALPPLHHVAAAVALAALSATGAQAQGVVNALCSTDAPWCEAAAKEFTRKTGIKVNQALTRARARLPRSWTPWLRTCSKSFRGRTSTLPGCDARRGAPPIARAIGKRRNAADRPARHLPAGLE